VGVDAKPTSITEKKRRYALFVLTALYVSNFVDRQILSILMEPIKNDLSLTDSQMGFLSGIAFALFYAVLGIPIARYADKGNRNTVIVYSVALWSVMTAVCGLAVNFIQLAAARVMVGVGEAGLSPSAHSLIADYYPPEKRSSAMSIYALGIPLGTFAGFLIGGWVSQYWGWRVAFFVVGIPGLVLAILAKIFVTEPRTLSVSTSSVTSRVQEEPRLPLSEVFSSLWKSPTFRHLTLGTSLLAFVAYGSGMWLPAFLIRTHGMSVGEVGTWFAILVGVFASIGTLLGGRLADRWGKNDRRWNMWIPGIAMLLTMPFGVAAILAADKLAVMILLVLPVMLPAMHTGPVFSTVQELVDIRMRAMAAAILLFIVNLVGMGIGPLVVGMLSDFYAKEYGAESLRYALVSLSVVYLWAAFHFFMAARTIRSELKGRLR